ncbi:MAG: RimK family alpha-L-glutamate ligase [Candidatus Heimdallarchaeota archaeon]|nr:RimK family alpha-L-glutamate ligase [Candidatus Heimdallarchaeota archaeon]MCK5048332.1 RimK family alpha-L-glutamate ligase [Candidatus Heimdallarchaeota archaeon]
MVKIGIISQSINYWSTRQLVLAGRRNGHYTSQFPLSSFILKIGERPKNAEGSRFDVVIPRIGSNSSQLGELVLNHFELHNIPSTISSQALHLARNKFSSLEHLSQSGIPVPQSFLLTSSGSVEYAVEDISPPYILKLIKGTHGIGVMKLHNKKEVFEVHETLRSMGKRLMIQEYIEPLTNSDQRHFVINGEIIASMTRHSQKEGEWRTNYHRGSDCRAYLPTEEEQDLAIRAAQVLGVKVAGVDIISDKEGKPFVLEVNISPGLAGITQATKKDIAFSIISYASSLVH